MQLFFVVLGSYFKQVTVWIPSNPFQFLSPLRLTSRPHAWWFYWGTDKEHELKLCSVLAHKDTWNKEYFCSSNSVWRITGVKSKGCLRYLYAAVLSCTLLEALFSHMLVKRSLILFYKQIWEKALNLRKTKTRKVQQNLKQMQEKESQRHSYNSWISIGDDYSCKDRYGGSVLEGIFLVKAINLFMWINQL